MAEGPSSNQSGDKADGQSEDKIGMTKKLNRNCKIFPDTNMAEGKSSNQSEEAPGENPDGQSDDKNRTYRDFIDRIESFDRYPPYFPVNILHLAKAGFFYVHREDHIFRVTCFGCSKAWDVWSSGDIPSHQRFHEVGCSFVKEIDGSHDNASSRTEPLSTESQSTEPSLVQDMPEREGGSDNDVGSVGDSASSITEPPKPKRRKKSPGSSVEPSPVQDMSEREGGSDSDDRSVEEYASSSTEPPNPKRRKKSPGSSVGPSLVQDMSEREGGSDSDDGSVEEKVRLSESVFMFPNKTLCQFGNIYQGEIASTSSPCAIKRGRQPEENIREERTLLKLGSHRLVISLIDSGTCTIDLESCHFLVLEQCHRLNLCQYLSYCKETVSVYDVNWRMNFCRQLLDGVEYVHSKLIIHKDLKPSNVLLSRDLSTIKIADFGSSQELNSATSAIYCPHLFGTMGYRPPESFGGMYISLKSDIFSLGVLVFFLLSNGKSPFGQESQLWDHNILNGIVELHQLPLPNPKSTNHLLKCMLSFDRLCRPSIQEIKSHPCWTGMEQDGEFSEQICKFMNFCGEERYGEIPQTEEAAEDEDLLENERKLITALECVYGNKYAEKPPKVNNNESDSTSPQGTSAVHQMLPHRTLLQNKCRFVFFDVHANCLRSHDPTTDKVTKFHDAKLEHHEHFSAASLDSHIYVFCENKSVHRLNFRDKNSKWERMQDMIDDHGHRPPVVVLSGLLFVICGSNAGPTKFVERFEPATNSWFRLEDKPRAVESPTLISLNDSILCIGGSDGDKDLKSLSKFTPSSLEWIDLKPMNNARYRCGAVAVEQRIFVMGGWRFRTPLNTVECYDVYSGRWTSLTTMNNHHGLCFAHYIDGWIFVVGQGVKSKKVEKYDIANDRWFNVEFKGVEKYKIYNFMSVQKFDN